MNYQLPTSTPAALEALAGGSSTIVAGATDYYPSLRSTSNDNDIVDITGLSDLRGITRDNGLWRIGALATWTDIVNADLPPAFAGLQTAAGLIGGRQIQNVATVAGNLCNASPAADGVPPLLTLDAQVELQSTTGRRVIEVGSFILGNRSTARRSDELLTAVLVPDPAAGSIGSFEKLGARAYLAISIVMVAAIAEVDRDGSIGAARVSVGACSPVSRRMTALEADLVGQQVGPDLAGFVTPEHLEVLSPIDDVRASAEYRLAVAPEIIARALMGCDRSQP